MDPNHASQSPWTPAAKQTNTQQHMDHQQQSPGAQSQPRTADLGAVPGTGAPQYSSPVKSAPSAGGSHSPTSGGYGATAGHSSFGQSTGYGATGAPSSHSTFGQSSSYSTGVSHGSSTGNYTSPSKTPGTAYGSGYTTGEAHAQSPAKSTPYAAYASPSKTAEVSLGPTAGVHGTGAYGTYTAYGAGAAHAPAAAPSTFSVFDGASAAAHAAQSTPSTGTSTSAIGHTAVFGSGSVPAGIGSHAPAHTPVSSGHAAQPASATAVDGFMHGAPWGTPAQAQPGSPSKSPSASGTPRRKSSVDMPSVTDLSTGYAASPSKSASSPQKTPSAQSSPTKGASSGMSSAAATPKKTADASQSSYEKPEVMSSKMPAAAPVTPAKHEETKAAPSQAPPSAHKAADTKPAHVESSAKKPAEPVKKTSEPASPVKKAAELASPIKKTPEPASPAKSAADTKGAHILEGTPAKQQPATPAKASQTATPTKETATPAKSQAESPARAKSTPRGKSAGSSAPSTPRSSSRVRHTVERLSPSFGSPSATGRASGAGVEVPAGTGTRLGDIPHISALVAKHRPDQQMLVALHRALYGRPGAATQRKAHILQFHGFASQDDAAKLAHRLSAPAHSVEALRSLAHLLNVESAGDKAALATRIADFLYAPHDLGESKPAPAKRAASSLSSSTGGSPSKKTKAGSGDDAGNAGGSDESDIDMEDE